METKDLLSDFFDKIIEDIAEDAKAKNQKIPLSSFQHTEDNTSGRLTAAHYIQYLVFGRAPGKFPPPDAMLDYVQKNPDILVQARAVFKNITEQSLAYLIGKKLALKGSDIYQGKKPGIDFLGVVEKNMPELFKQLARNEAIKFTTELQTALR